MRSSISLGFNISHPWDRKFPKLDKAMVQEMDRVFSHDIPKLVEKASRQPQYGSREAGGDHYAREWRR